MLFRSPWTTYKKLGFHPIFDIKDTLPQWLKELPKGYKDRIEEILNLDGTNLDIINSIMVLDL